jgi:CelD/BcsL family acetyltransferase involved in cellulose biosynthesis
MNSLLLTVEWVRDRRRFAELREEWGRLHVRSGVALFGAWEWLYPWCQRIAPEASLRLLLVWSEGRLVGALPLVEEAVRGARRLSFVGARGVGSDGLDVLVEPGMRDLVLEVLADALERAESWDLLELGEVPAGESMALALMERLDGGPGSWEEEPRYRCPWIDLRAAGSWEAVLRRSGRRDNVVRRQKWLGAQDGYRVRCLRQPVEAAVGIRAFLDLHARRWAAHGGSQGIRGPWVEAFHRDAAWFLAERGVLRLYLMELGGRPVSALYGLADRTAFLFYQSGADPALAGRSVGLVLLAESIRAALEEGFDRYEFLHGEEPYKLEWSDAVRSTVTHRLWRSSLRAGAARLAAATATTARTALSRRLPQALAGRIRQHRRTAPL